LESRLRARLGMAGSMEYSQTLKVLVTPAGRRYLAHTASARRTSASGCGGWPTAASSSHKQSRSYVRGNLTLSGAADLAGWGSPGATDHKGSARPGQRVGQLSEHALLAGYPTPRTPTGGAESRESKDDRGSGGVDLQTVALGITTSSSRVPTANRGVLNPALARWLMGYPPAWCACAVTATPSSRNSRRSGSNGA